MNPAFSAEKLVLLRKTKGYSQEKLAGKAGINIRSLQRLEKAEVQPQPHTLKMLADALEVPVKDLFDTAPPQKSSSMKALLHFSSLGGMVFPLGNLIAPLALWLYKKQQFPEISEDARSVLNFQISMTLYIFIALALFFSIPSFGWMLILIVLLALCMFLLPVIGGFNTLKDRSFFYPLTIKFLS